MRNGFVTVRLADIFNRRTSNTEQNTVTTGHISVVQIGSQMTFSGSGKIWENFQMSGQIQEISGVNAQPTKFYDEGFFAADVRQMNFDETYYGMHYDCHDS